MIDTKTKEGLEQIAASVKDAIAKEKTTITQVERDSGVSKTIIYKIIRAGNYEVQSLLRVIDVLNIDIELK